MNIEVDYKDQQGHRSTVHHRMTRLAFAKHMAIAGQGYDPRPAKLYRILGKLLNYSQYLSRADYYADRFSEPPPELSDPTEKGQFSNIAGKAIADFLAKRLDHATLTVNYEAAMRVQGFPVVGRRPDLLAFAGSRQFALEAKGYTSAYPGDMAQHKAQASAGHLQVNFSVACVSYNLFRRVKCCYHDPYNDDVPFNSELFAALSRRYYSGLAGFLKSEAFRVERRTHQGEEFIEVDISRPLRYAIGREWLRPFPSPFEPLRFFLVLPGDIDRLAADGLNSNASPFKYEAVSEGNLLYIDNDRVGLRVDPYWL